MRVSETSLSVLRLPGLWGRLKGQVGGPGQADSGALKSLPEPYVKETARTTRKGDILGYARVGDSLCVTRLDRLGRSLKELLETVENLKAHDIHLVSLEERIDTTSAGGELVFHVFGAIAHFERRLISERTRDGIAAARKRGRKPGRPPLDRETVSAAQALVEAGLTAGQAAKQLDIGRATAYRITRTVR